MSPFEETETFPRGRRVLLVPLSLVFLIGPYGTMLDGAPSDPLRWIATMLAIAACTALLSLGLARPRRRVIVDPASGVVRISATPPPPRFVEQHHDRPIAAVTDVEVIEHGLPHAEDHGYRAVVRFADDSPIHLRLHRDANDAQRAVDHLVLLGLPGTTSVEAQAEARRTAEPPVTWL